MHVLRIVLPSFCRFFTSLFEMSHRLCLDCLMFIRIRHTMRIYVRGNLEPKHKIVDKHIMCVNTVTLHYMSLDGWSAYTNCTRRCIAVSADFLKLWQVRAHALQRMGTRLIMVTTTLTFPHFLMGRAHSVLLSQKFRVYTSGPHFRTESIIYQFT